MSADALLDPPPARPLWLWTLADLALLLVGFFVLVQATDRRALTQGLREGFGASTAAQAAPAVAPSAPDAIPLASAAVTFAAGSAVPHDAGDLLDFATTSLRDPRVTLKVTGATDNSDADRDPVTGSAQLLAADRARSVTAFLIAHGVAPARIYMAAPGSGRRGVLVTMSFTGDTGSPRNQP
jgi:outer membrane protein OmpA-like peptidoglycan-associated protein